MLDMLNWLLRNAILLFALVFIYGIMDLRVAVKKRLVRDILTGLLIGGSAVLVMMNPWELSTGLIFDARSVLLSIAAAFFGLVPSLIAGALAIVYRAFLGGPGVYAGILTVIFSVSLGLLWQKYRGKRQDIRYFPEFVLFGIVTHLFVVAAQLTIPWPTAFTVIQAIALPFLAFYPIVSGILALAIHNQKQRLEQADTIRQDRILLRAVIESPKGMTAMAVDTNCRYLVFNNEYRDQVALDIGRAPKIGDSWLDTFRDHPDFDVFKPDLERALEGAQFSVERSLHGGALWIEALWSPIKDDRGNVIGATQFCQNISERIKKDEEIIRIARHDSLTGLRNRRAYSEELARPAVDYSYPVSVVMADINGLKITNDAFGHAAGDQLLLKIAEMFKTHFRPEDRIYRIGGDEFVIFMQNTTRAQAEDVVDALKAEMERTILFGLTVSVSFGIDTNHDGTDLLNSVKLAEIEMYDHKLFEISSNRGEAIKTILSTLKIKNPREDTHSRRVAEYCQMIGEAMHMRKEQVSVLKMIGNLHDIGKIAVEEAVLNKKGPLSFDEWAIVRRHPEIGYRILSSSTEYADIAEDILAHHERWDGKGYPKGLKGEQIPLRARIIAVADTFEAMTADRPYRKAVTAEAALAEIRRCSGTQFDPEIASAFASEYERRHLKNEQGKELVPTENE